MRNILRRIISPPELLIRIDRRLLLTNPGLWATKIHYVLYYAICYTFLLFVWGIIRPVNFSSMPNPDTVMLLPSIISGLGIIVWIYFQRMYDPCVHYGVNLKFYEFKRTYVNFACVFLLVFPIVIYAFIVCCRISPLAVKHTTLDEFSAAESNLIYGGYTSLQNLNEDSIKAFAKCAMSCNQFGGFKNNITAEELFVMYKKRGLIGKEQDYYNIIDKTYKNISSIKRAIYFKTGFLQALFIALWISMLISYVVIIYTSTIKYFGFGYLLYAIITHLLMLIMIYIFVGVINTINLLTETASLLSVPVILMLIALLSIIPAVKISRWLSKVKVGGLYHILYWQIVAGILFLLIGSSVTFIIDPPAEQAAWETCLDWMGFILMPSLIYFFFVPFVSYLMRHLYSIPKRS